MDIRKVPLLPAPIGSTSGWCAWCGQASKGFGVWHAACWKAFTAHTDQDRLVAAVVARDGAACAACARPGWIGRRPRGAHTAARLELDHRIPLWAVTAISRVARRSFYGLLNLQLLCGRCHVAKTAREATLRAEMKRNAASPISSGDAPVCAALTDLDAATDAPIASSAPRGRPVETCARGQQPEHVSP